MLWRCLEKKGVSPLYTRVIKDMYEGGGTCVRTLGGVTNDFAVGMGLHQGSTLSPFLFTLVIDELTIGIQDALPWCMLFADDIVLIDETSQGVNDKLERWRHTREGRGFRVSRSKKEYLHCCFSGRVDAGGEATLDGRSIPKVDKFKHLASIILQNGDIDEDINQRIKVGWQKWKFTSSVLCDKRVPLGLKGKVYQMIVRPVVLYGSECWPLKKTQV